MSRNIASTKCRKIGGLRNYQRGGNLKKGEVNFERGGSDPLGNYVGVWNGHYDITGLTSVILNEGYFAIFL